MELFERKWFRFIVHSVLSIAMFIIFLTGAQKLDWGDGLGVSAVVLICSSLFYVAFDLLGDFQFALLRLVRFILLLAGALLLLLCGIIVTVVFSQDSQLLMQQSPWMVGWCGCNMASGLLAFFLYYKAVDDDWSPLILPLIQVISVLGGYFLYVILFYLGRIHSFFPIYLGGILGLAAFVLLVRMYVRNGFPGSGGYRYVPSSSSSSQSGKSASASTPKTDGDKKDDDKDDDKDTREKESDSGSTLKGLLYDELYRYSEYDSGNIRVKLKDGNVSVSTSDKRVRISGRLEFTPYGLSYSYGEGWDEYEWDRFENSCQSEYDDVKYNLRCKANEFIENVKGEFVGYDGSWDVNVDVNSRINRR